MQKPCKYRVCRLVGPAWVHRFPVSWACLGHLGSPWGLLGAIFGTFLGHLHPELYPQRCSSERNFIVEDIVPDLFSLLRPLKNHWFFKVLGRGGNPEHPPGLGLVPHWGGTLNPPVWARHDIRYKIQDTRYRIQDTCRIQDTGIKEYKMQDTNIRLTAWWP